jgi:universal stress protein A
MSQYNTLLMAVDLSEESEQIAVKATEIASGNGGTLHIIHVIEPQEEIHQQAKQQLTKFGEKYGVAEERQHIVLGRPEVEIHALSKEIDADLVVVGSHGRYGLALLMGSTANGVLHGATCDVLAVRVGKSGK